MGTCNGILSACAIGGYAMESRFVFSVPRGFLSPLSGLVLMCHVYRCHLGKSIIYDTVTNLSWAVDLRTHGIVAVIEQILNDTWAASEAVGREVPEAITEEDCIVRRACRAVLILFTDFCIFKECYRWEYGDYPK